MRYLLITAFLLLLPASLAAQSIFGMMRSTVTDSSDAVVANACTEFTKN